MRKKSHISLAKHIVNISGMQSFQKHRKAFYIGSVLPDCKPSFITQRHEITGTFNLVEHGIEKLTQGYREIGDLSTVYFTRLGEIVHYIADYFTFPHNKEYPGNMKQHCIYEGELKHALRSYIKAIRDNDLQQWKADLKIEDLSGFHNNTDICNFLKEEHEKYIQRRTHSVQEDLRYIVGICSRAAMAILHVCMMSMEQNAALG